MNKHYLLLTCLILTNCLFGQTTIFNSSNNTSGLAIDTNKNSLFVATIFDDMIYSIDLDDINYTPNIILSNVDGPEGLAFKDGFLYISLNSNNSSLDKIIKIDVTETNPNPVEISNTIPNPNGLLIYNNKLYVNSQKNIYTIDLTIENPTPFLLINDLSTVFGTVGLCVWNNYLYVADTRDNLLVKYNLNTSNPTKEIVFNDFYGNGLTLFDDRIYSIGFYNSSNEIIEIDPINETMISFGQSSLVTSWDLVTDENSIYASSIEGGEVIKYDFLTLSLTESEFLKEVVYPNPTNDYINFNHTGKKIQNIELYDLNGRLIKKVKIRDNKFEVEDLKSGTYLLKSDKRMIGKIIKN